MGFIENIHEKFRGSRVKVFIIIFFSALIAFFPFVEADIFWLIKVGEHVINCGFPSFEPLTMHTGLHYPVQQWISAVIFHLTYRFSGASGIFLLTILAYVLISFAILSLTRHLSGGNLAVSVSITMVSIAFLTLFITPRPQIFSYLIFTLQIFILEKYLSTGRTGHLLLMPLLSLILINMHAALWPFFIILFVPYFLDGSKKITSIFKLEGHLKNKQIFATFIISILIAFVNPYGIDNMLYSIRAWGCSYEFISEMMSPDFKQYTGIMYFIFIFALVLTYIYRKSTPRLRYILITIGVIFMALQSMRNFPIMVVCAAPLAAYQLRHIPDFPERKAGRAPSIFNLLLSVMVLVVATKIILIIPVNDLHTYVTKYSIPEKAVEYILENIDTGKMKLYNSFNTGGYLAFKGIRTFIDSRAEAFTKKINKSDDILKDEIDLNGVSVYYKDIFNKYGFTHWLVYKGMSIDILMGHDGEYEKIYEDDIYVIYEKPNRE